MKRTYINLLGEKHPLCFSLSATEELCDVFGDLDAMKECLFNGTTGEKLKATIKVLDILLRAGRRYCETVGEPLPPAIKGSVADLIDGTDAEAVSAIFSAITGDADREVEAQPKNA